MEFMKISYRTYSFWDKNNLIGCGALKLIDKTHGEFKSIRISKEYQNTGYGKKLLNELFKEGLSNGAIGGKIIGSGGGGFLLFCCKKNKQKKFFDGFKKLPIIKFNFTDSGSEIIFRNN